MRVKLIALLLLPLLATVLQAQEAIPASGSEAVSNEGNVSYTVGQLIVSTFEGTNGSVAHGVQQPYEISIIVGIKEAAGIELICTAYPNPTTGQLRLKVENFDLDDLSYYLFNMNGNLLESNEIITRETTIPMSQYLRATYILKIISKSKEVKTFSIIKN